MTNSKYVTYEEFGAVGDGVHEDFEAIWRAHEYANEKGLAVKGKPGATYYINDPRVDGVIETVKIRTDVDWTDVKFTIDDTKISLDDETDKWRGSVLFTVVSDYDELTLDDEATLRAVTDAGLNVKSTKVALKLGYPAMIIPYDSSHKVYRRLNYGGWPGSAKHEIIVIDKDGNIDPETPLIFDYDRLDYIKVIRLDIKPVTILGGEFTTIASRINRLRFNEAGEGYYVGGYINRGFSVKRSYTTVKGLKHYIKGEIPMSEQVNEKGEIVVVGMGYAGFLTAGSSNHVTFEDCVITARRCYNYHSGGALGTYAIQGGAVNKLVFKNCRQSNFWVTVDENCDIHPADENTPGAMTSMSAYTVNGKPLMMHWGCGGTSHCKNMEYIDSLLSRFDAHEGLLNGKISGSTINGLEVVGKGNLVLENSRLFSAGGGLGAGAGNSIVYLRDDYASTWKGEVSIKDLDVYATVDDTKNSFIFCHTYNNWNYGYQAYFPNLSADNIRYFDKKTRKLMPRGTKIRLVGNSLEKEPMLYAKKTIKCPAIFPDVDEDGDGLVDGTKIPYDDVVSNRGVTDPDCMDNHNPVIPPSYVKIVNNACGYDYIVQDTSEYEGGGFFGNTEFICDTGSVKGTKENTECTFKFTKI